MNRTISAAALFAGAVVFGSAHVHAEKADKTQMVELAADVFGEFEDKGGGRRTATLEGNVVITQGTIRVGADQAVISQENGGYRLGEATGKPVTFRQKRDDGKGYNEGVADRVEFDEKKNEIHFISNVRFKLGDGVELAGEYITYNSETEAYSAANALPGKGKAKNGQQVVAKLPPPRQAEPTPPAAKKNDK